MQCSCFSCCISYRYKQRTAVFLLLLGDSGVGKTSLFISRVTNAPPEEYIPDTYDGWCDTTSLDGKQFQIGCLDTNGGVMRVNKFQKFELKMLDFYIVCWKQTCPVLPTGGFQCFFKIYFSLFVRLFCIAFTEHT